MSPRKDRGREVYDTAAAAGRFVRAVGRQVAYKDVENLQLLVELRDLVDQVLTDAVIELHDRHGYSWGRIALVLGTTRQAVQQRFRPATPGPRLELPGQGALL